MDKENSQTPGDKVGECGSCLMCHCRRYQPRVPPPPLVSWFFLFLLAGNESDSQSRRGCGTRRNVLCALGTGLEAPRVSLVLVNPVSCRLSCWVCVCVWYGTTPLYSQRLGWIAACVCDETVFFTTQRVVTVVVVVAATAAFHPSIQRGLMLGSVLLFLHCSGQIHMAYCKVVRQMFRVHSTTFDCGRGYVEMNRCQCSLFDWSGTESRVFGPINFDLGLFPQRFKFLRDRWHLFLELFHIHLEFTDEFLGTHRGMVAVPVL